MRGYCKITLVSIAKSPSNLCALSVNKGAEKKQYISFDPIVYTSLFQQCPSFQQSQCLTKEEYKTGFTEDS
jgi:hypothetical protein